MKVVIVKTPLLILGILSSLTATAVPFATYRAKLSDAAGAKTLEKAAADRVADLRKALGTDGVAYGDLFAAGGAVATLATSPVSKETSKGTKKTTTGVIKSILGPVAEKMRTQEEDGTPPPFDPSKFDSEIDADIRARRHKFCDEQIGSRYRLVVDELIVDMRKNGQPVAVTPAATALETRLIAALSRAIPAEVTAKLGKISSLDFVDGRVTRIVFSNAAGESVPMSLSMLSTVRTVRDRYFLITLECVERHVDEKANEEKPSDVAYQLLARELQPLLAKRVEAAKNIGKKLAGLSKAELNRLIDLFLMLSSGDIPTEEEMEMPADPKTWKVGSGPSFSAYVYQLTAPVVAERDKFLNARAAAVKKGDAKGAEVLMQRALKVMAPVEDELADYQYYQLVNQQLYQLQDWLFEEAERERQIKKRIDDMTSEAK